MPNDMKMTSVLREKMKSQKTVVAIGAYDAFSAVLIERAGSTSSTSAAMPRRRPSWASRTWR